MKITALSDLYRLIENRDPQIDELPVLIRALCLLKLDDWDTAHHLADTTGGIDGDWLHGHLHRCEGDLWNADYWYRRAGRARPEMTLDEEWIELAEHFIEKK